MIYQFIDNLFEAIHIVRHFFRAFACKSYFVESHGVSMCDRTQGCCEWYWCPKRKGGDDETRVYIAGPITGVKGYADRFKMAEQILEEAGHEPVSPVIPGDDEGETYRYYINRGFRLLMGCDAICMLPGWSGSRGAMLEKRYAETVKLPVYFIDSKYDAVRGPLL